MVVLLRVSISCFLVGLMMITGCSKEEIIGDRVPVFPATGVITVDGEPVEGVAVTCHFVGEKPDTVPASSAFTNKEGKFAIGTFEAGDGAPPGEYKLTFKWGTLNLMNGRYVGDKLNGRYLEPEKSEHTATIKDGETGEAVDLGTITLTTK